MIERILRLRFSQNHGESHRAQHGRARTRIEAAAIADDVHSYVLSGQHGRTRPGHLRATRIVDHDHTVAQDMPAAIGPHFDRCLLVDPGTNQVRPLEHHESGQIEVVTGGERATGFFRIADGKKGRDGRYGRAGGAGAVAVPGAGGAKP